MGLALSGIALGVLSKCKCSNIYRTQRSCGKVMLLHLSVSHSVHEGGCIPACTGADITPSPPTATAADGTHPAGVHSVYQKIRLWCY